VCTLCVGPAGAVSPSLPGSAGHQAGAGQEDPHSRVLSSPGIPKAVLRIRDPGSSAFLTPGSGSVSRMEIIRIRVTHLGSYFESFFGLEILKFFVNSVLQMRIRDPVPI
jgi:hypothetical protein